MKRMIWFTADLHLGHEAIIKMQNRPFANVDDMNHTLIHNITECVKPDDKLYILGDVSHHITPDETSELVRRIHCHKYLILGNHDVVGDPEHCRYDESLFESVGYYLKINAYDMKIVMMHYPLLSWHKMSAGSIMLHGHIHSDGSYNAKNMEDGIRRYDVGVDANHYYPVNIFQVKDWVEHTTERHNIDHHWKGKQ